MIPIISESTESVIRREPDLEIWHEDVTRSRIGTIYRLLDFTTADANIKKFKFTWDLV
jgi:hypothetical protein